MYACGCANVCKGARVTAACASRNNEEEEGAKRKKGGMGAERERELTYFFEGVHVGARVGWQTEVRER